MKLYLKWVGRCIPPPPRSFLIYDWLHSPGNHRIDLHILIVPSMLFSSMESFFIDPLSKSEFSVVSWLPHYHDRVCLFPPRLTLVALHSIVNALQDPCNKCGKWLGRFSERLAGKPCRRMTSACSKYAKRRIELR
jgi:hypothetical protein